MHTCLVSEMQMQEIYMKIGGAWDIGELYVNQRGSGYWKVVHKLGELGISENCM